FQLRSPEHDLLSIIRRFPSLTSLKISIQSSECGHIFTALSSLDHLVHLNLSIDFVESVESNTDEDEHIEPIRPPQAQLKSVRALGLGLRITSHADLHWLNLPVTVPN